MASLPLLTLVTILLSLFKPSQVTAATCSNLGGSSVCDDNCNELGACSSNGVITSSQNCQAENKICRNSQCEDPGWTCSYCSNGIRQNVVCTQGYPGSVPSLQDCTTYYSCSIPNSYATACKCAGSSFDPITRSCGGPLPNGQCTNFSPTECTITTSGLTGTPDSTDTLGFRCMVDVNGPYVQWTVCTSGWHFSKRTGICEKTGLTVSSLCPNSAPSTLANGSSTCSYIKCYGKNDFEVKYCLNGYHYSQADRGCIPGGCS